MSNEESAVQIPSEKADRSADKPAPSAEDPADGEPKSGFEVFRRYSILMETALTLSKMLLLFTAFLTVFLSWLAGAEPVWIAARGVIVTLTMGLTLWAANWFFTQRVMETVLADAKKLESVEPAAPVAVGTVEKRA